MDENELSKVLEWYGQPQIWRKIMWWEEQMNWVAFLFLLVGITFGAYVCN